jgi:hypothetical protein
MLVAKAPAGLYPIFPEYQMRVGPRYGVVILLLALLFAACRKTNEGETKPPEPVYFPAPDVCAYPHGGPGKLFMNLGGGKWAVSNPSEPGSAFECVGSKRDVRLWTDGDNVIQVEYVATGVEKGASLVSLTYSATGRIANESTYRNTFANLVTAVSRQALGAPPPDLFRKKLSNLASYSQPGSGMTENFDVGKGFISLTREASGNSEIRAYVKFFPDTALKIEN